MKDKVSWSAEVKPLLYISYDKTLILFCWVPLIRKEAVAFIHLLLYWLHDLAPSVFEVCFFDHGAIFERADFLSCLLPGVMLLALPTSQFCPLKGFRKMLLWPCANWDANCCCLLDFLVIVVVFVNLCFYWRRVHRPLFHFLLTLLTSSFPPFSRFLIFFHTIFWPSRLRLVVWWTLWLTQRPYTFHRLIRWLFLCGLVHVLTFLNFGLASIQLFELVLLYNT